MPIYEYVCQDCGSKFEKLLRRPGEAAQLVCPSCGKDHLEQALSTFAAHSGGPRGGGNSEPMCPSGGPCPTPGMCGLN